MTEIVSNLVVASSFIVAALTLVIIALYRLGKKSATDAEKYKAKYERELFHRKSSEVRLGHIGENLAPFTRCWPWDPNNFRFLGNPVDGVQFNDDEIIFVEIKTGGARLSKSQKQFKQLVEAGKVSFVTFKIGEEGTKLLKEGEEVAP